MSFCIIHELQGLNGTAAGRMRVRAHRPLPLSVTADLTRNLDDLPGISGVRVNPRVGSVLFFYADQQSRLSALRLLAVRDKNPVPHTPAVTSELLPEKTPGGGLLPLLRFFVIRPLLPRIWRMVSSVMAAMPFLLKGVASLLHGRLSVDVLDAAAIAASLLMRDFRTVSVLTLLLGLGETLEYWTRRRSLDSLTESLALNVDSVWLLGKDGTEASVPLGQVQKDDLVVVRDGGSIPVDGIVEEGCALVNQSSMTGEPLGVPRARGAAVFAGTVVEEGRLVIRVNQVGDGTRLRQVISFIEQSEALKAGIQGKTERLADLAVPFTFALAALVWLITRNPMRAASVLLVDYSCALRLATPLAVLSAMREGAGRGVLVKGGRFLETLASADAVVFDKTGTLTHSLPRVVEVAPAPGYGRAEVLRLAACLEEHFPHPVARAVVRRAEEENLLHAEEHSEVEYVVAHGVASHLHGKRALIGSRHYVCHDEGVAVDEMDETIRAFSARGLSLLYLALDGRLAGIVGIEDPLRPEAPHLVERLRREGMRVIMLTGDDERTAGAVAARLGIAEYRAQVLPADKAGAIRALQAEGRTVIMLGDGINDSPALSAADVGVSLRDGADLAREVADVVLADGRLSDLLVARELGRAALRRIHTNFAWIMTLNTLFLAGGLIGLVPPGLSAVLHNVTTVGVTLNAMRPMLPRGRDS